MNAPPLDNPAFDDDDDGANTVGDYVAAERETRGTSGDDAVGALFARSMKSAPSALTEERAVLGAILLKGKCLAIAREQGLSSIDFFRPAHATIFAAMVALADRAEPVDVITVVDELQQAGQLDSVGGAAALAALEAMLPTTGHVEAYARRIVKASSQRRMLAVLHEGANLAMDGQYEPIELTQLLTNKLGGIAVRQRTGFTSEIARARDDLLAEDRPTTTIGAEPLFESTATLLDEELPTTAWLIEGLLTQGAVAAISGEPKTTKTWAAISMAIAVASGTRAFGEFWVPEARPVALFLTEDGRRSLRNRLKSLAAAGEIDARATAQRMHHRCMKKLDIRRIDDAAVLLASLRALPEMPALVVLDPFRNLIGGANEDKASEMAPVMERFRAIRNLTGATIHFVHHAGKSGETSRGRRGGQKMRGSGAIHGAVDCGLYLDDLRGDATHHWMNTATVEVKDAEGAGRFGLELRVRDEEKAAVHAAFTFWRNPKDMYAQGEPEADDDDSTGGRGSENKRKVLACLRLAWKRAMERGRDPEPMSVRAIEDATKVKRSTAHRHATTLVTEGHLDFVDGSFTYRPSAEEESSFK